MIPSICLSQSQPNRYMSDKHKKIYYTSIEDAERYALARSGLVCGSFPLNKKALTSERNVRADDIYNPTNLQNIIHSVIVFTY